MYKDYYGLTEDPFSLTPDKRFFYKSNAHRKSLDDLEFGLSKGEGFVVVTGEVGVGKSMLIQYLQARLARDPVVTGWITMTRVGGDDLLRLVARAFNIAVDDPPPSKAKLLSQIETFFSKHVSCLVVDEAQGLSDSGLEALRMLSNLRTGSDALLQIVLLGQPQLRDRLVDKQFEPLRQRVMAYCFLQPLDATDTREYIAHRLKIAGWQGDPSLSSDALYRIHVECGGIPRRINLLCDRLFRHGCLREKHRLDKFDVFEVISDLGEDFFYAGSSSGEADRTEIHPLLNPLDGSDGSDAEERTRTDSAAYALSGAGVAGHAGTGAHRDASGLYGGLNERPIQPLRRSASAPDPDADRSGSDDETRPMSSTAKPVFSPKLTPRPDRDLAARRLGANGAQDDDTRLNATASARSASPHSSSGDRKAGSRRRWRLAIGAVAGIAVLAGLFVGLKTLFEEPQSDRAPLGGISAEQNDRAAMTRDELSQLDTKALSSMNPLMTSPDRAPVGTRPETNAAEDVSAREPSRTGPDQVEPAQPRPAKADAERDPALRDAAPEPVKETATVNGVRKPDVPSIPESGAADATAEFGAPAAEPAADPAEDLTAEAEPAGRSEIAETAETTETFEAQTGAGQTQAPEPIARPETAETQPDQKQSAQPQSAQPQAAQTQAAQTQAAVNPDPTPAAQPAETPQLPSALARAQLTTEVRSREPVDQLRSPIALNALKGGRLNYFTEVIGMSGRSIRHRWIYKGQTVLNLRFPIGSDRWRVYTTKTIGQNTGPWQIVVTDENGRELHQEQFVIE